MPNGHRSDEEDLNINEEWPEDDPRFDELDQEEREEARNLADLLGGLEGGVRKAQTFLLGGSLALSKLSDMGRGLAAGTDDFQSGIKKLRAVAEEGGAMSEFLKMLLKKRDDGR